MKHILITGGTDGIGKEAATQLTKAGYHVTVLGRDAAKTAQVARELDCDGVVADITDAEEVCQAMLRAEAKAGPIDILINNAGRWLTGDLADNDVKDIEMIITTNTLGTIYCTKAVVPGMVERRRGRIINVISQAGLYGNAGRSVYVASKWAITGFTKSLQAELKPAHISVTGFYPGAVDTQLFAKANDPKQRSGILDPAQAAAALVYVCGLPESVAVPELGLVSLDY